MSEKMTQSALEQYLLVARKETHTPEQAVDLIKKIIDSPSVYSFYEFFDIPVINSLQTSPTHQPYYDLLRLFAFGTYLDYAAKANTLPLLSTTSLMKLRHLSIISMARKSRTISYSSLCRSLGLENIRELEDLIIEAFYADIIKGKLDQMRNQLEIEFTIGRDVTDEQLDDILYILEDWCKNCNIALKTIETEINNANSYKQKQLEIQTTIENEVANLKKSLRLQSQEVESLAGSKESGKKSLKTKGIRVGSSSKK